MEGHSYSSASRIYEHYGSSTDFEGLHSAMLPVSLLEGGGEAVGEDYGGDGSQMMPWLSSLMTSPVSASSNGSDRTVNSGSLAGESPDVDTATAAQSQKIFKSGATKPHMQRKRGIPPTSTKAIIRRPPNSFIIYRREKHAQVLQQNRGKVANNDISKIVSAMWRNEDPEVRKHYTQLSQDAKKEHFEKYPDYKYAPRKNKPKRKKRKTKSEFKTKEERLMENDLMLQEFLGQNGDEDEEGVKDRNNDDARKVEELSGDEA